MAKDKDIAFLKKLTKVNDNFSVTMCENGYVVDISGEDTDDNWISTKIVFDGLDDLSDFIGKISKLEKR